MLWRLVSLSALFGFLFGFDEGVIAGALPFIAKQFAILPVAEGFMTAAVPLGAVAGAIIAAVVRPFRAAARIAVLLRSVRCRLDHLRHCAWGCCAYDRAGEAWHCDRRVGSRGPDVPGGACAGRASRGDCVGVPTHDHGRDPGFISDWAGVGGQRTLADHADAGRRTRDRYIRRHIGAAESPRWLVLRQRSDEAAAVLRRLQPNLGQVQIDRMVAEIEEKSQVSGDATG
jgi:hypothetical protein